MEFLKPILLALLCGSGLAVAAVIYTISHYSQVKIFLSDIFKALGFFGKWFRKKSVSNEIEATLNGVINDFNKNFENSILPNCKIEWVTAENQQNLIIENQAIVCLSFDKRDHDLNFYNATFNYIQTGLISKAKPFIKTSTRRAIDLLTTNIIIKKYRREVLRTFNTKFAEVELDTQEIYHRLNESDEKGLYSNFLLPELHHLGEVLFEKTPSAVIENELEQFINWFYELSTREFDDRTSLRFENNHVKIGVILVAKLSTYDNYGVEAYTKWAEKYASENYNAIYLLSIGTRRHAIAMEVANVLTGAKGFEQVNKNSIIKKTGEDGRQMLITCICLRPDPATIRFNAWQFLKSKFDAEETVIGIVETVTKAYIIVNISGLQCSIENAELSTATISDATKIFREEQELQLKILDLDIDKQMVSLSNSGTQTDPQLLIKANLSNDQPIKGIVVKIQKNSDNYEKGIMVKCTNPQLNVFVPRSKTTFSRYTDISKKFLLDSEVEILLEEFQFGYGNYIGKLNGLIDPWESELFDRLKNGEDIDVVIKEIQERFITCEIIEGLECKLFVNEISWVDEECTTDSFKIDQVLNVKVIAIDKANKRISVSLRQFSASPVKQFFDAHADTFIMGTVNEIDGDNGVYFFSEELEVGGYVRRNELVWANVYPISNNFSPGDEIKVRPLDYRQEYNSIVFSCKQCLQHDFDQFLEVFSDSDYLEGKVLNHFCQIATIEISYKGLIIQAYVHKSKISNCAFTLEEDIPFYLPIGQIFHFILERVDERNAIIELSRKEYLMEVKEIELGASYPVYVTKIDRQKKYFYSDDLEGYSFDFSSQNHLGELVDIIPIRSNSSEFHIV